MKPSKIFSSIAAAGSKTLAKTGAETPLILSGALRFLLAGGTLLIAAKKKK